MVKFFKNNIYTCAGSPIHRILTPVVEDDGSIELIETGKENTDEYIQSFAESCSLEFILAKYMNGDTAALNQRTPMFGDFTKMPSTYAEVLQLQIDSNNLFAGLPKEIKEKFDNDPNKFFAQAGTEKWIEELSPILPSLNNQEKEVVAESDYLKE